MNAPLLVCMARDPKQLYKMAQKKEDHVFSAGLLNENADDMYEEPVNPEIMVDTVRNSPEWCVQTILDYLDRWVIRDPDKRLNTKTWND